MARTESIVENHLHETEARWFAVYTKYKREKVIRKDLMRKGIEVYLPIQTVVRQYTSRKKTFELPLISCYVFVKITKGQYLPVLQTENVVKFVRIAKNLIAIPQREMDLLKQIVGEGIPVEAEPMRRLHEGDAVEIIGGRLTGLRGVLVDQHGDKQMVVDLENMGYSLRLTVDSTLLRRLE